MSKPDFASFAVHLAEMLGTEPGRITRETTALDVEGWDSVRHANIILTLEDTYNIQFADEDVASMDNVGMLFDKLIEQIGE